MIAPRRIGLLLLLAWCICCGPGARQKALSGALTTVNAARDGFIVWDNAHQTELVDRAATWDNARADLLAYRKARESIVAGFEVAYRAIAAAAVDRDTPLPSVIIAVTELVDSITKFKAGSAPAEAGGTP